MKLSSWDAQTANGTQKLWSYRAGIRIKQTTKSIDYSDLAREIKRHRPLNAKLPDGESWFVANLADLQLGKHDMGGIEQTVRRTLQAIDNVDARIRELRKCGRKLGTLCVAGLGDILEGCDGQYAAQVFTVELNRRQQIRIAVRLIRDAIARWAKQFKRVVVLAVPGNHGEHRKDSKLFTEVGDNDDVAIFERIAEIFAANPKAYGHVEFLLPENELYVVLDMCGTKIGFAHGHIAGSGTTPQQKIRKWWEDQTFGEQPIGAASILVTGHYHHFSLIEYGSKIHIQCPALENGSEYFINATGQHSRPGLLTFVIGPDGWSDLAVL